MSAENVYKFINDCLALDLKVDPVVTSSLTAPSAADITEATTAAAADGAVAKNAADAAAAADGLKNNVAAKPENVKETLKLILAELGYEDKGNGVFVRGKDNDFVALNIATSNYWEIKKRGKPYILFGGKKRKTNRRKNRRSNRKTLGRKK
jgi:hypothetical protein